MGTQEGTVFWQDDKSAWGASFLRCVQFYSDKTAIFLKAVALVLYPLHPVVLIFSLRWNICLIDNRHTVVGVLKRMMGKVGRNLLGYYFYSWVPSGSNVWVQSSVLQTSNGSITFRKIGMLHKEDAAGAIELLQSQWFSTTWKDGITRIFFQLCCINHCYIRESKDMYCSCHGSRMQAPRVRGLVSLYDIQNMRTDQVMTATETREVQNCV